MNKMLHKMLQILFNILGVVGVLLTLCSIDVWDTKRMAIGFIMILPVFIRSVVEDLKHGG